MAHESARGWRLRILFPSMLLLSPLGLILPGTTPRAVALGTAERPALRAAEGADDRLLAIGKTIFVERCASCHGERGDKALKTGLPLSQRKLDAATIASAVKGRLKDKTPEQQRAVVLYIESLIQK